MNKYEFKKQIIKTIDENRGKIIEIGKKIYSTPEFWYKEFKTTNIVVDFIKNELNLDVEENIAVTGCRAEINSNKTGSKIAILGELDAISCKDHKDANEILDNFTPKMTKEEYLKLMDSNDKIIKA